MEEFGVYYGFVEIELVVELLGYGWFSVYVDDCVDVFGFFVDVVCEMMVFLDVDFFDVVVILVDDVEEFVEIWSDGVFFEIGVEDYYELVVMYV